MSPVAAPAKRDHPYGVHFIGPAFDRTVHGRQYRCLLRWLYRSFRRQEHSSPFSARAQVANAIMRMESVAREAVPS